MSNLTAQQETLLRRWVAGELNRREEAELEALAREDDFLAEALAGLRTRPEADHGVTLTRLRTRLEDRQRTTGGGFVWRRLAAAVLLLAIAATAVWLWPSFGVNTAADEATESLADMTSSAPLQEEVAVPPPESSTRTETARATDPAPAPRRERMSALSSSPRAAIDAPPRQDELAVSREVPPSVLPSPPPPPPPPPPAPRQDMLADRVPNSPVAGEESEDVDRLTVPSSAAPSPPSSAPVPYSVGARAIAADTPNAVPDSKMEGLSTVRSRMAGAVRPQGAARRLRGYVRDDNGDPLAGVMVTTPGVPAGLFTDSTGYFELGVDRTVDRLQFSNTGYADEEIAVEGEDAYFEITLDDEVTESVSFDAAFAKTTIIPNDRPTMVSPSGGYRQLRRQLRTEKPTGLPAGRVRLEFMVTEAGELRKFRVLETPDKQLSRWLIDRLRQTGTWTFYQGEGPHTVHYSVKFQ